MPSALDAAAQHYWSDGSQWRLHDEPPPELNRNTLAAAYSHFDSLLDQQMASPRERIGVVASNRGQPVTLDAYERMQEQIRAGRVPTENRATNNIVEDNLHNTTYLDVLNDEGNIDWGKIAQLPVNRANELLVQAFNSLQTRIRLLETTGNAPQT